MGDSPARSWLDREPRKKRAGRPSTVDRQADVHDRALHEFNRIQSTMRDSRLQCLQDRRFVTIAGAQWEGPLQDQFANKPRFEANLIQMAMIRVYNEYRNNRMEAAFTPKDGAPNDRLADTCADLYRADQQDSVAEEAHDNAFDESSSGGFGAWRVVTTYEDENNPDTERQRIRIEPIFDADSSVFFDLNAKRQDKADAKKCYVLYSMTTQAYIDTWDDDPSTWPKSVHQYEFDWATPSVVYVCEYYEVEIKAEQVFTYENLDKETEEYTQDDFEKDTDLREMLEALGSREVKQEKRKTRKVHKYIFSGSKILEDCGYIAGKCIPIVPVYGKRWFVDNVERCSGIARTPKDMLRLLNMQLSKLGEIAALSSVEKPILLPEQVQGLTEMWANDNIVNMPYLLVNPITGPDGMKQAAGPIAYTKSPQIPPATAALVQITSELTRELLGNQQNAEEIQPNVSGKAIELIQHKIDMQSYIYLSNMGKAIKREGEIWLSMAKEIMVTEGRKMKTVTQQGKVGQITLMQPMQTPDGVQTQNDITKADFDVSVSVGPTSQSRKAATVRALTGLLALTDTPEDRKIITGLILMNMEGEGLTPVNEYYRKQMVLSGVITPTPEEEQEIENAKANQQPSPEQKYLDAAAQEAEAKAKKANADTLLSLANADKSTAQADEATANAAKALASVELEQRAQLLEVARTAAESTRP